MSTEIESRHPAYTLTQFAFGPGQVGLQITRPNSGAYIQLPIAALEPLVHDLTRYLDGFHAPDRAL